MAQGVSPHVSFSFFVLTKNIPGNIQGQVGSEQTDGIVPVCGRGLDWMTFKGPIQPKLFNNSMILSLFHKRETAKINHLFLS